MHEFDDALARDLAAIANEGLSRQLRRMDSPQSSRIRFEGRELLNFSSNDYLGLANHPAVKMAAQEAVHEYGAGSGASRLICGSLAPHHELDEALAGFKRTQAALSFSSGYATALGTICALLGKDDFIIVDRLIHACVIDAARLSGATLRVFRHNDLDTLENVLRWAAARRSSASHAAPLRARRILVVTESVFSMDGDQAPLAAIVELKDRYGAWLMVDEAHSTGLFGTAGRGLAEAGGVDARIEVQMGTLGKALGAAGGYICGSRRLIELLVNRARSFIFSTAPTPASAAAAAASIALVQSAAGDALREALWERVTQFADAARGGGLANSNRPQSAIIPLPIGDEREAMDVSAAMLEQGILVPAVRYPTVARGKARLRLTLTAAHSPEEVAHAAAAITGILGRRSRTPN